jgi:hypothetical protein
MFSLIILLFLACKVMLFQINTETFCVKKMKKLVYTIITIGIMAVCGCNPTKNVADNSETYGVHVTGAKTSKPDTLNVAQVDSFIRHDRLPRLEKWTASAFVDDETGKAYTYKTLYDNTTKTVYTVKILNNDVYVLSKRFLNVR